MTIPNWKESHEIRMEQYNRLAWYMFEKPFYHLTDKQKVKVMKVHEKYENKTEGIIFHVMRGDKKWQ